MSRKQKRIENYNKLLAACFAPKEARRLRDLSAGKLNQAIQTRQTPEVSTRHRAAATREKTDYFGNLIPTGRVKYQKVEQGLTFMYQAKYTYIVTYDVKSKEGTIEGRYIAWTSESKLTKTALLSQVKDYLYDPEFATRYQSKVVKKSVSLITAYEK